MAADDTLDFIVSSSSDHCGQDNTPLAVRIIAVAKFSIHNSSSMNDVIKHWIQID